MNETELERILVRLVGDGSLFQSTMTEGVKGATAAANAVEQETKRIESFTSTIKTFAVGAMSALASLGAKNYLESAFGMAEKKELALIRMNAVLESNGRNVAATTAEYRKFAVDLEKVTTSSVGTTMGLLRQAETYNLTGAAAEKAAKDAIALAAVNDGEASSYIRLTAALASGNVQQAQQFARMIPQLRGIHDQTQFLTKANQLFATGMKTAAAESDTFGNQMTRLGKAFDGFKMDVGKVVAEAIKPFVGLLQVAADWIKGLGPTTKSLVAVTLALVAALLAIPPIVITIGTLVSVYSGGLTIVLGLVVTLLASIAAGAVVLAGRFGGIGKVMEYVKEKALAAWEWLKPVRQAVDSLWQSIVERGQQAWMILQVAAIVAWDVIKRSANLALAAVGLDLGDLRDKVVIAFLAAEFAIRNFGDIAALVWLSAKIGLMSYGGELEYFFQEKLPRYANHMRRVFQVEIENLDQMFKNLFENAAEIFKRLPELIADPTKLAGMLKPITRGLQEVDIKLPDVPPRELKKMEVQWRAEFDALKDKMGLDFATFAANKMAQFAQADKAKATGEMLGAEINKGVGEQLQKFDAILRFGAESLGHITEYRDRLANAKGPASGGTAAPVAAGAAPVIVNNQPAQPPAQAAQDRELANLVRAILDKMPDKNPNGPKLPELLPAGLG